MCYVDFVCKERWRFVLLGMGETGKRKEPKFFQFKLIAAWQEILLSLIQVSWRVGHRGGSFNWTFLKYWFRPLSKNMGGICVHIRRRIVWNRLWGKVRRRGEAAESDSITLFWGENIGPERNLFRKEAILYKWNTARGGGVERKQQATKNP